MDCFASDVDSLIQEASEALAECAQEGDHMRAEFVQAFKKAEQSFEVVRCCHEKFQEELLLEVEELTEVSRDPHNILKLVIIKSSNE